VQALGTILSLRTWKHLLETIEKHHEGPLPPTRTAAVAVALSLFLVWSAYGFSITGLYMACEASRLHDQTVGLAPRLFGWGCLAVGAITAVLNAIFDDKKDWREHSKSKEECPDQTCRYITRGLLAFPVIFAVNALQGADLPLVASTFSACPVISMFLVAVLWGSWGSEAAISPITGSMLGNLGMGVYGVILAYLVDSEAAINNLGFSGCLAVSWIMSLLLTSVPIAFFFIPYVNELKANKSMGTEGQHQTEMEDSPLLEGEHNARQGITHISAL
jgi:hypothetical protein